MNTFFVLTNQQPSGLSRETNTEVNKTAIHQQAARGWLQISNLTADKICLQPGTKSGFMLHSKFWPS